MLLLSTFKQTALRLKKRLRLRKPTVRQLSLDEAHRYWQAPPAHENQPQNYILGRNGRASERSHYLTALIASESSTTDSILEIGCNVGRNLNVLYERGFHNLSGIEINTKALALLKQTHPGLADVLKTYEGTVEEWIGRFTDSQFDVVFTMAVLQHIHYESDFIFKEIARITKKRLIVMENEVHEADRNFPRNYKKVFESVDMVQVMQDDRVPALPGNCRVFRHRDQQRPTG